MTEAHSQYTRAVEAYEKGLPKLLTGDDMSRKAAFHLSIAAETMASPVSGETQILDFGCGGGAFCCELWSRGLDARGVDIFEYRGREAHMLGEVGPVLTADEAGRLFKTDEATCRLPFADASFDLVLSDQTLEHVFPLEAVLREQFRVLRPGGVGVHRFPHRFGLVEQHTRLPLTALTRFRWYLWLGAALGLRTERQRGLTPAQTVESNTLLLRSTIYRPTRAIAALAGAIGFEAHYRHGLELGQTRAGRLYCAARRVGLGGPARMALGFLQDCRTLVLRKPGAP